METSVPAFYDRLASGYHLIFADWQASIERQATALDALIRAETSTTPGTLLDCACGIGTQALGLAERGYPGTGWFYLDYMAFPTGNRLLPADRDSSQARALTPQHGCVRPCHSHAIE